jgi:hypothetical protein
MTNTGEPCSYDSFLQVGVEFRIAATAWAKKAMKKQYLFILIIVIWCLQARSSSVPVQLAIVPETSEASAVADVLSVQFSKDDSVHLLERAEIEKVYREQGLSAGNRDYLKLGQILGADGLLMLETVNDSAGQSLNVRLLAVKPGVVLTAKNFSWPMKDMTEWSPSFAKYLGGFFPKLTVLTKDAIPISVVNLRSAIQSDEARESERQLKLLAIQRLSEEPQFFVLERQRMELLSNEKEFKSDDSAFWSGSYLLEGVIDQNGYSKDVITINARLTPPKGGKPITFEVSGSRTNLAGVINLLAAKVTESLNVTSAVREWNVADEAAQYFNEAEWALRWRVFSEAEMAAESAWALGKKDEKCAIIRVRALLNQISWRDPSLGSASESQNIKDCEVALSALTFYYECCRTSTNDCFQAPGPNRDWYNPNDREWYHAGIDCLDAATRVLRDFCSLSKPPTSADDKFLELRRTTRQVAEFISQSPEIHASYFVGDHITTSHTGDVSGSGASIFGCQLLWGCFWQEKPEDTIALYRELMGSTLFGNIHQDLWYRKHPRLIGWTENDRRRIPTIWNSFVQELSESTNVLWQLESKALRVADLSDRDQLVELCTNFFDDFFQNREAFVANNVDILNFGWHTEDLIQRYGGIEVFGAKDYLERLYYSDYGPRIKAMHEEWKQRILAPELEEEFEQQKQYLANYTSYDAVSFGHIFRWQGYTKSQAAELKPLINAYTSNLTAQVLVDTNNLPTGKFRMRKYQAATDAAIIEGTLGYQVDEILKSPRVVQTAREPSRNQAAVHSPQVMTNILTVTDFLPIPLEGLPGSNISNVTITAHHWQEGKLLLDFQYGAFLASGKDQYWHSGQNVILSGIAVLDPTTEHWTVISCPQADLKTEIHFVHHYYSRSTLLHGEIFNCGGGEIRRYDFQQRQWRVLACSNGDNYELFNVNGHLYAANENGMIEILDGGKATRILASSRRQPPASVLDTRDLGTPTLFAGPDSSLRVCTQDRIFNWTGDDWHEDVAVPRSLYPPQVFADGLLFRFSSGNSTGKDSLSRLLNQTTPELCIGPKEKPRFRMAGSLPSLTVATNSSEAIWKLPPSMRLDNLAAALWQSNLYLLGGHSVIVGPMGNGLLGNGTNQVVVENGYNAFLLCFSSKLHDPQKVFLNFDAPNGYPPLAGVGPFMPSASSMPPAMLVFAGDNILIAPENRAGVMGSGFQSIPAGYKTGVWVMSADRLTQTVAAQKETHFAEAARVPTISGQAAHQTRNNP